VHDLRALRPRAQVAAVGHLGDEAVEAALEAQLENALAQRDVAKQVLDTFKEEQNQKGGKVDPRLYGKVK
jgi:RNA binding exosome subunit